MSVQSLFNPNTDSKGIWYTIHRMAILAITEAKKAEFINYMTFLSKEFPCEKCRTHIKQFIVDNPFHIYMNVSYTTYSDVGFFKWSFNLHNAVNMRLGKPIIDFSTAHNLYKGENPNICTAGCDEPEMKMQEPIITPKSAPIVSTIVASNKDFGKTEPIKSNLKITSINKKK